MKTYLVGGAVRDALLGLPVQDCDWVVVGSSPQALLDAGYLPVGQDFPVFLHPRTRQEYALARTERKTGAGYKGFSVHAAPEVTLEEDLARRDLTINSIALPADAALAWGVFDSKNEDPLPRAHWASTLIDPYGGQADLAAKVLRHVTPAFREDPVRILRVARFAARYTDFAVAPETMALMQEMVASGEVDHLVPERVWQELSRGLMEALPSRMFSVLRDCGALARLLPEVQRLWGVPQTAVHHPEVDTGVHVMMVLDMAAHLQGSLPVRFAALTHDLGKGTTPVDILPRHIDHETRSVDLLKDVGQRLRVPTHCMELATLVAREHGNIHRSGALDAKAVLRLLERCDALRSPARFREALLACECDARGRLGFSQAPYPARVRLGLCLDDALALATAPLSAQALEKGLQGPAIGDFIRRQRLQAIADGLAKRQELGAAA